MSDFSDNVADADDVDSPVDSDKTPQERIEELQEEVESLQRKNEKVRDDLLDANAEKNKYEQKVQRLKHENEKLKQSPLFVATVEEITDEGVIIRQHGNNQEALTEAPERLRDEIDIGTRVAVNNSLSVVETLEDSTDMRARVMEVSENPEVGYEDIGGLDDKIQEVSETVEMPLNEPELFENAGIEPPGGILLHGPPGTGKTMLAKAVANRTDATFIKMAGSELVHKFIGEGARLVRDLFEVARQKSPSVIFIDEIDAVASKRTDSKTSGDAEVQRTMMQLLSEMDGFDRRGDVKIIAATNRFDMLDRAILRPGRFDRLIEVPPPDEEGRAEIFQVHTRDMKTGEIDYERLARLTDGMSGADIKAVCTEAGMFAIRDRRDTVEMGDFLDAYDKVRDDKSSDGESGRMFA
ncbi:MAG: proteasome-activating nucleotidase [Halobacteria archaeon]|nr:proteasome-activating nucleotidase [Halobacteria archaeon]